MRSMPLLTTQVSTTVNGRTVMVTVNITQQDPQKWEELDDSINEAVELAAHLPDEYEVDIGHPHQSWLVRKSDGLTLMTRIWRDQVGMVVVWEQAANGYTVFRAKKPPECPDSPNIHVSRSRGIVAVAKDVQRRAVEPATKAMPFNAAYIKEIAEWIALEAHTAARLAAALKSEHRRPDTWAGSHRGERGSRPPAKVKWKVDPYAGTEFEIYALDPDKAVAIAAAIRSILWPEQPVQKKTQEDVSGLPLFQ